VVLAVGASFLPSDEGGDQRAVGGRDGFCDEVSDLADDPAAGLSTGDIEGLTTRSAQLAGCMDAIDPPTGIADVRARVIASLRGGTAIDDTAGARVLTYVEQECGRANFLMAGLWRPTVTATLNLGPPSRRVHQIGSWSS
jgi:hypothetical protein